MNQQIYNIFNFTNMINQRPRSQTKKLAVLFRNLGQPARLRILMAIGEGEACVCHLEAALGYRQAYISQHLMELRKAGLVTTRRESRNVFYRLKDASLLDLIHRSSNLLGLGTEQLPIGKRGYRLENCPCPHCDPEGLSCSPIQRNVELETTTS